MQSLHLSVKQEIKLKKLDDTHMIDLMLLPDDTIVQIIDNGTCIQFIVYSCLDYNILNISQLDAKEIHNPLFIGQNQISFFMDDILTLQYFNVDTFELTQERREAIPLDFPKKDIIEKLNQEHPVKDSKKILNYLSRCVQIKYFYESGGIVIFEQLHYIGIMESYISFYSVTNQELGRFKVKQPHLPLYYSLFSKLNETDSVVLYSEQYRNQQLQYTLVKPSGIFNIECKNEHLNSVVLYSSSLSNEQNQQQILFFCNEINQGKGANMPVVYVNNIYSQTLRRLVIPLSCNGADLLDVPMFDQQKLYLTIHYETSLKQNTITEHLQLLRFDKNFEQLTIVPNQIKSYPPDSLNSFVVDSNTTSFLEIPNTYYAQDSDEKDTETNPIYPDCQLGNEVIYLIKQTAIYVYSYHYMKQLGMVEKYYATDLQQVIQKLALQSSNQDEILQLQQHQNN